MMSAEKINDLRKRIVAGEVVSDEELIEALRYRMEQRASFSTRSRKSEPAAPKTPPKVLSTEDAQKALDDLF